MDLPFLALDPTPRPWFTENAPDPTAGLLLWDGEPMAIAEVDQSSPYRFLVTFERGVQASIWSWQDDVYVFDPNSEDGVTSVRYGRLEVGSCAGNLLWRPPELADISDTFLPSGPAEIPDDLWVDIVGHPGHQLRALAVAKRPNGEPNPPEYLRWPRPGASFGPDAYDLRVSLERRVTSAGTSK